MTQKARPAADVLNDGWSPTPLYTQIDEAQPDDEDFVADSPCVAEFTVRLARLAPPVVGPDEIAHELTARLAGPAFVLVELLQGDTLIASDTFTPGTGFADYTLTVTRQEAAHIKYEPGPNGNPNLRVRVTTVNGSGSGNELPCCTPPAEVRDSLEVSVVGPFGVDGTDIELTGMLALGGDAWEGILQGETEGTSEPIIVEADARLYCAADSCDPEPYRFVMVVQLPGGAILHVGPMPLAGSEDPEFTDYLVGSRNVGSDEVNVAIEKPCIDEGSGSGSGNTPLTIVSITNGGITTVQVSTPINYTITFNKDVDASTFTAADITPVFGTGNFSVGAITETSPTSGVFTVVITPLEVATTVTPRFGDALDIKAQDGSNLEAAMNGPSFLVTAPD